MSELKEGLVHAYNHKGRVTGIVEVRCKTDFAARTDGFQLLAHDLAMQVAAMAPETVEELLEQAWIRDPSTTIKKLIEENHKALKEPIEVTRIFRVELGK